MHFQIQVVEQGSDCEKRAVATEVLDAANDRNVKDKDKREREREKKEIREREKESERLLNKKQ